MVSRNLIWISRHDKRYETEEQFKELIHSAASSLVKLLEADIASVLSEALTAQVQVVFPTTILTPNNRREDPTSGHKPDETVSVGAASTLPGALAELPGAAEPDVLVTHLEDRFNFSSETLQSLSHV